MASKGNSPKTWQQIPLGQISERVTRKNSSGLTRVLTASGKQGLIDQREYFSRSVAGADLKGYYHLRQGEFAYNRSEMEGYPYGAIKRLERYTDGVVSTLYICFRLSHPECDEDFYNHLFESGLLNPQFRSIARIGGRAHGLLNVNESDFFGILIAKPDLDEQQQIKTILNAMDEAIDATRSVIEQARRLKTSLLQELLTKGLGHHKFQKTKIGRVPAKWKLDTVGNLCEFSSGTGFSYADWSKQGLPIIRIQNLNGSTDFNYYDGEPDPKWIVEPGELLFAWAGVKGVSSALVLGRGPRGLLNQHIYRIRANDGVDPKWLYAILGEITHRIEAKAHGFKTSLVHVHKADITDQVVAVPPPDEQIEIANRVKNLDQWESSQVEHLTQLEATKTALSQGLLTGRISLPLKGTK